MSEPEAPRATAGGAGDERIEIDVRLDAADPAAARLELVAGLTARPRRLPSRYFYDDRGSALFERICEQPEYYPTRAEAALLRQAADEIAEHTGATTLVEVGSGAATKTRLLLDAMERAGNLRLYVPLDVSEGTMRRSARELVERYPGLRVHGVVGDFMEHLERIPDEGERRLVIFLGGTIGNLSPTAARGLLRDLATQMRPGEPLLLGVDRIKDEARLRAAYDDAAGVTAEFNRNVLRVVNRLAGGDFEPERFDHHAPWNAEQHRIEMWLVAREAHTVRLAEIDLTLELAAGEGLLTEISTKYDQPLAAALLADSGFRLERWYSPPEELFGLCLAVRE
ncbi:MAG TPA: L-histidine N(alpha)-methyltransferase [Thermoanaerobaculia bacterium]|nr:L-histidine N(alpha)-methyltransferase [Thermoanaerobaculia bacterium]